MTYVVFPPKTVRTQQANRRGTELTTPRVNSFETENSFVLELALPGIPKEQVTVELNDSKLTVKFHPSEEEKETEGVFLRKEFHTSAFEKIFEIPKTVDAGKITAKHENGVLLITLPKREVKKAQKISVE